MPIFADELRPEDGALDGGGEGEVWGLDDAPTAEATAIEDEDSPVARAAELTLDVEPRVADARPLKVPVVEPGETRSVATIVVRVVVPLRADGAAAKLVGKTRPPDPAVPPSSLLVVVVIPFAPFGSNVPHWQIDWPADASLGAAHLPALSCSHSKVGMVPSYDQTSGSLSSLHRQVYLSESYFGGQWDGSTSKVLGGFHGLNLVGA